MGGRRRWATMAELAEEYGIAVVTIRKWISQGRLPAYRLGARSINTDREDFEALMTRRIPTR